MSKYEPGERVTYLDIIHATVMHHSANGVTISYWGAGMRGGEQIVNRVSSRQLEKGWKKLDGISLALAHDEAVKLLNSEFLS